MYSLFNAKAQICTVPLMLKYKCTLVSLTMKHKYVGLFNAKAQIFTVSLTLKRKYFGPFNIKAQLCKVSLVLKPKYVQSL